MSLNHLDIPLNKSWRAQRASSVQAPGSKISTPGFSTAGWLPAIVPGTVLNTLVVNGIYSDPFFGRNNENIPDISSSKSGFYTYWFRNTFELPATSDGQRIWLDLRGINYTATLFLNGKPVDVGYLKPPINTVTGQPLAPNQIQGMFLRHSIDVTNLVARGQNVLAVLVEPPDPPGIPDGNGGGSPNIGNNVTMRYTVGWDWVEPIRDRNTGIWDQISIRATGPVRLRDPQVITKVLDTNGKLKEEATVELSIACQNATNSRITGALSYVVPETGQTDKTEVTLQPGETMRITFPLLEISSPRLWWPHNMGEPELYTLNFAFSVGQESDQQDLRFGIREIRVTTVNPPDAPFSSRQFAINGKEIFLRGANWIGTDALLRRENLSSQRYRDEVRMMAEANLNLLRVWGGGITERPEFYQACDEFGILVMQDFWISNEYNPRSFSPQLASQLSYPKGYDALFTRCAQDTIRMLRNHPSLLFWCGGNETEPPENILSALRSFITGQTLGDAARGDLASKQFATESSVAASLDPTRILVPKSTAIGNDLAGDYDDGPYGIQDPENFFTGKNLKSNPFNPEIGSVGTPVAETLLAMMSRSDAEDIPLIDQRVDPCEINPTWCLHDYIPYADGGNLMEPYGYPTDLDRFTLLAQILNYEQYRALFEGYTSGLGTKYTGVMLWKGQNPWQGLRGSLYDWCLDTTGGLFGARTACRPINLQFNPNDETMLVANTSGQDLAPSVGTAQLKDLQGQDLGRTDVILPSLPAHSLSDRFKIDFPSSLPSVYFLSLSLSDRASGRPLTNNLYWRSSTSPPDFTAFNKLPEIVLEGSASVKQDGDQYQIVTNLINPSSSAAAFFLRLSLRKANSTERVLPAFFEDNYFTIFPSNNRRVNITCSVGDAGGQPPELWVQGYNVGIQRIPGG